MGITSLLRRGNEFLRKRQFDPASANDNTAFVWRGSTYSCSPGATEQAPSLEAGGFDPEESLVLQVDASQFSEYDHQEILNFSNTLVNFSSTVVNWSNDSIRNPNQFGKLSPQAWQIVTYMEREWLIARIQFDPSRSHFNLTLVSPHATP